MYRRWLFACLCDVFLTMICSALTTFLTASPALSTTFNSEHYTFRAQVVVDGLRHPWSVTVLPNHDYLITERPGQLSRYSHSTKKRLHISGLPGIHAEGQGGMLGIAQDHDFETNAIIYLAYSGHDSSGLSTEVVRAQLQNDHLTNLEVIFKAKPKSTGGQHFGGRILLQDNKLFITLGDRGDQKRAQQLNDHAGSLIRIHSDGSIPSDNPFVKNTAALPEIFSYGHRNIQGIALHPGSQKIWIHEHGPQGGDEINIIRKGANYGWPVITYGVNYVTGTKIGEGTSKPGMEQPLYYWTPSIAPSGMVFYDHDVFARWHGNLLVGSLKFGLLLRLVVEDGKIVHEERMLNGQLGRIRDVIMHPDGSILLLTDEKDGALYQLVPADS